MALHHRHKQRILTTIITLFILVIALDTALLLGRVLDAATTLLYTFAVAIGLTTAYQCYNFRHSHEHSTLVNTLTQIFLGTILLIGCVVMLLIRAMIAIDVIDTYLALCAIVIILTLAFLKRFDRFLDQEVRQRFPMGIAPGPQDTAKQPQKAKQRR